MKYKILLIAPIVLLVTVFNFTHADTISDLQAQLKTVLDRISVLKAELVIMESGTVGGSCIAITTNLSIGMQNVDVKNLQIFLAQDSSVYPEKITSGYFGRLTQSAVQRWQAKHGVVSSGTPNSTGYGVVGPKTRRAMVASCGDVSTGGDAPGADNVINFSFTTNTGRAPYESYVKLVTLQSQCMSYKIDWGDGTEPTIYAAPSTTVCGSGLNTRTIHHVYSSAGNYSATLYSGKGIIDNLPKVMVSNIKILEGDPAVKVLSPNGGETLKLGDKVSVKWQVSNHPDDSAVVFYIVGPSGTYRFAKRSHRTDTFDWLVGDRVCDGNGCDMILDIGTNYKVRAVLYSPADACIDFCSANDTTPTFLANDESDTEFTISQLGTGGSNPLTITNKSGNAPFTTDINIKIEPINNGVGNFEVDFGDGSNTHKIHIPAGENRTTERTIYHTYSNAGDYNVRLRPIGAVQHIGEELVQVDKWPFSVSPNVDVYAPATVRAKIMVETTCTNLTALNRIYTIDWGDNTETTVHDVPTIKCASASTPSQTGIEKTFIHDYSTPGSYVVSLTTKIADSRHKTVKVLTIKKPSLTVSPQFGFSPLTVFARYTADESCVMKSTDATYTVDWGDGADTSYTKSLPVCGEGFSYTPISKEMTHTYNALGRYNVSLTLTKSDIGSVKTNNIEVVVDKSVLRNGWRKLTKVVNDSSINVAAAIQSLF